MSAHIKIKEKIRSILGSSVYCPNILAIQQGFVLANFKLPPIARGWVAIFHVRNCNNNHNDDAASGFPWLYDNTKAAHSNGIRLKICTCGKEIPKSLITYAYLFI